MVMAFHMVKAFLASSYLGVAFLASSCLGVAYQASYLALQLVVQALKASCPEVTYLAPCQAFT